MNIRPFKIAVSEEQLNDLLARLKFTRVPRSLDAESWDDGASLAFMERLISHWRLGFDWRAQENCLNRFPQFIARVGELDVHFVHEKGKGPAPMPLVLTHGWPGSFAEMQEIIPLLSDPAAHGGDAADAFDVVVPSLPGFGFSQAPQHRGVSSKRVAEMWSELMTGLGYDRFGAQGGDIGAGVSMWLGRLYPKQMVGLHLNYIPGGFLPPLGDGSPPVTAEEEAFRTRAASWFATEGAYSAEQSTKPLTLAYALSDSPVGLAAWIAEKFRTWSDCNGDVERVFTLDQLLTDISIYWFSGNVASTLRIYKENRSEPLKFNDGERVEPVFGMALFPAELPTPPRSWVERVFDVKRWTSMPKGGHFAAMEQPQLLAEEIRAFFRPLR
jgi:pimeloyl-ACP methyl ester carboxylesterase